MRANWKPAPSSPIGYQALLNGSVKVGCIYKRRTFEKRGQDFEWIGEFRDEPAISSASEEKIKAAIEERFRLWTKKKS